ncbi:alpha/beta hydrolase [Pseudooceanicola sp. CBS1P-1]|uniref:Alpha/beta hydrolase fold domain-containing protein n=1 Tax=Pseudooceanicola albus TaxID=2692189 RepID=A0A6L7G127_9RHOB|nr:MULTISPECIES: alpha/beta hydrolase [Pseudooceanicola]MBT9383415.1 alpha/beta hydrolase [Pseudooceanicola endophyticus]MXN16263.1 alpha/beta hydrolase fold domain-containing protein [Pseudooceanicola albus]
MMRHDDLVYSRAGGQDRLADLYLPEGAGPHPVILFLHGGGWRFGDRRLAPDLGRFFADKGFAMVSIDYRLSDEAKFPAAVIDVKTAIRWIRSVAGTYALNPRAIGLWGSSAGAHLGALAALSGAAFRSDEWAGFPDDVQAVADGYGPTDFLQIDGHQNPDALPGNDPESARLPPPGPSADSGSMESRFIGAPINEAPEVVARANPAAYATAGACPFLILHGDCDAHVPQHQSRLLFRALAEKGAEAEFLGIHGLGHGFLNRNDLDDGGPHRMERRLSSDPDAANEVEAEIFETIRAFFARTLG